MYCSRLPQSPNDSSVKRFWMAAGEPSPPSGGPSRWSRADRPRQDLACRQFGEGLLDMHQRQAPEPMRTRRPDLDIPKALDDLVLLCLKKKAVDRPKDAAALEAMLAALLRGDGPVELAREAEGVVRVGADGGLHAGVIGATRARLRVTCTTRLGDMSHGALARHFRPGVMRAYRKGRFWYGDARELEEHGTRLLRFHFRHRDGAPDHQFGKLRPRGALGRATRHQSSLAQHQHPIAHRQGANLLELPDRRR